MSSRYDAETWAKGGALVREHVGDDDPEFGRPITSVAGPARNERRYVAPVDPAGRGRRG
jgi:hypothetical protein